MKNKLTTLLVVKPILILALVIAFKPTTKVSQSNNLNEETQTMRGYFLEEQSMKIIVTHKRVQALKEQILGSPKTVMLENKSHFVKMVKDFNLAIEQFEKLTEYKSKSWNTHRKKFIVLMKNIETQQMDLHQSLTQRKVVSI